MDCDTFAHFKCPNEPDSTALMIFFIPKIQYREMNFTFMQLESLAIQGTAHLLRLPGKRKLEQRKLEQRKLEQRKLEQEN